MRNVISALVAFVVLVSCSPKSKSIMTFERHVTLDVVAACIDGSGAFGHAFAISPTTAVTAKHVAGACGVVPGKLYVGGSEAIVIALGNGDSAVVKILTGEFSSYAPIGKPPAVGDTVCFTRGCGKVIDEDVDANLVLVDVPAFPGDSGSPVYNADGYIVGLVSARTADGYMVSTTSGDYRLVPQPPVMDDKSL